MGLIHKIYRSFIAVKEKFLSNCRILHIKLKYPSLHMDAKCTLSKNCEIVCVDGANFRIKNSFISAGTIIVVENGATLIITDSYIGPNTVIAAKEYIEIQSNCEIAEMVVIRDQNHDYGNEKLIKDSKDITGKIVIEQNVWIGAKATILKGVHIGKNSVVGAHSLLNKSFPDNSLIVGAPARLMKK